MALSEDRQEMFSHFYLHLAAIDEIRFQEFTSNRNDARGEKLDGRKELGMDKNRADTTWDETADNCNKTKLIQLSPHWQATSDKKDLILHVQIKLRIIWSYWEDATLTT